MNLMLSHVVEHWVLLKSMMRKTAPLVCCVDQPHIPSNNLGAIEIEGSVYFIINMYSFLVDSGIRIPPGEVYLVSLNEWENLCKMTKKCSFVLCDS